MDISICCNKPAGMQITMIVPATNFSGSTINEEGGHEKLKYPTIEKSEEMKIKNSWNSHWPT